MIKELRIAHVWYDSDFHAGHGIDDEEALSACYDSMVDQDIVEEGEWQESGYESKSDFIEDLEDVTVSKWSLFLEEKMFKSLPDWKGFNSGNNEED